MKPLLIFQEIRSRSFASTVLVFYVVFIFHFLSGCTSKSNLKPTTAQGDTEMENKPPVFFDQNKQLFQMIIDLPEMNGFYHIDVLPERKPLKIVSKDFDIGELALFKFGLPVEYIQSSDANDALTYLEFTDMDIDENSADIAFLYSVEGVKGNVRFVKNSSSQWEIVSKSIVEQ